MFLETDRLLLKIPHMDHFEEVCRLLENPMVMRYIADGKTRGRDRALKSMHTNAKHWEKFGFGFCSVFLKETNAFIGRGGLIHIAFDLECPDVELGYILSPEYWGKGYATEIATCALKWGFENLSNPYVMAMTWKENTASQNVLKKVGFAFDREDVYPGTDFKSNFYKTYP